MDATTVVSEAVLNLLIQNKPKFQSSAEALVFALHLVSKELGLISLGCGEKDDPSANQKLIPDQWNSSFECFSFRYKTSNGNLLIKYLTLGEKILVNALTQDQTILTFEINIPDFIKESAEEDYRTKFKDIENLISLFRIYIINKVQPQKKKSPMEEKQNREADPLRIPNSGNDNRRFYEEDYYNYPSAPFGVGGSDLFPPSPFVPGFLGPTTPFGGGNVIGPNHPGFGPVNDPFRGRGPRGPLGGGGMGRFDPYGPPGTNFPFGPDNDHLPPPGPGGSGNYFL